jgi:acetoin utilization protein AcuB
MFNPIDHEGRPNGPAAKTKAGTSPKFVGDVMITEVKTLTPDQTFADVVSLLAGNNFHHIIVAVDGYLMGVLSDRDVYRQLGRVSDWTAKKVGEIMSTNSVTVSPAMPLSQAAEEMLLRRVSCLPVVADGGKLVGLLTSTDIIRLYQDLQRKVEREL